MDDKAGESENSTGRPDARLRARLDQFFSSRSQNVILVLSLSMAIAIGLLEIKVRGSGSLLILYLVPVALAAWYGGRRVGAVIAIYCAIAWYLAGAYAEEFQNVNLLSLWIVLARGAVFLVLTQVIARLRESMRQQHDMMQFIVHDLRSPISSAITGLLTLQQNSPHLDELEAEMISLALVSNRRALTLVNSLLDIAKLESRTMPLHLEQTHLETLVENCFEQVALWAQSEQIQLRSDVQVADACLDPELTSRVLVNLMSNALKFSPPNGVVQISIANQGAELRFAVRDQGPGIPLEFAQTIFEPFAQVAGTKGGTGLGLTFCRLAVAAQGGRIWVESGLGKGTTMLFTLPKRTAPDLVDRSKG